MTAQWVSDGWCLVGRYGPLATGSWVITHHGQAVILETPPAQEGDGRLAEDLAGVLGAIHARPLFLTYTHNHWDHTLGFKQVHKAFPHLPTLVHRGFSQGRWKGPFDEVWDGEVKEVDLGGEALLLFPAPKHHPSDQILIFRGVAMMGDWALGAHPDANRSVSPREKLHSLARLKSYLLRHGYVVHTTLSVHGNEIRRGIDFIALLDEMHAYCTAVSQA